MTTFAHPLKVRRTEAEVSVGAPGRVQGKVPSYWQAVVSVGNTGVGAASTTTLPLFVAPSGSIPVECYLDVLTGYNQGASNTNLAVGTATSTGILFAATTVNTTGRRAYAGSGAQVSANAIAFTADTTIQAVVSIDTSAVTAGEVLITVVLI
jgi:hypothetical protein